MKNHLFILPLVTLATSAFAAEKIDVSFKNYNQAETARNFNNWVKLGDDNKILHLKELSPVDGEMTLTIPDTGLYQSVMILDTDGYTPYYFTKPGTYQLKNDSEYLFIAARTVVKDRHSKESFAAAHKAQTGLKVTGNGSKSYVMPNFDQKQLHKLTTEYNNKMLDSKISFVYGDGKMSVNEEHRTWSNTAGWEEW